MLLPPYPPRSRTNRVPISTSQGRPPLGGDAHKPFAILLRDEVGGVARWSSDRSRAPRSGSRACAIIPSTSTRFAARVPVSGHHLVPISTSRREGGLGCTRCLPFGKMERLGTSRRAKLTAAPSASRAPLPGS